MNEPEITRNQFLRGTSCVAAGIVLHGVIAPENAPCSEGPNAAPPGPKLPYPVLAARPYHLLCLVCAVGEGQREPADPSLKKLLAAIRQDPDRPVLLQCNAGDVYFYQDPGPQEDTPQGADFNRKRDLDVLYHLGLAPGSVLPARALLLTLLRAIPTTAGICGYGALTGKGWEGCAKAKSGSYEKGREKGIYALISPRSAEELAAEKQKSLAAMYSAKAVTIRPHILMCAVCQYGGGLRPPFKDDNLPELLEMILTKRPDVLITFARGADWMMCAPCPGRSVRYNACVNTLGSGGLSNEKRDLDMLQRLGLHFGSPMEARKLLRLIFEKIPSTQDICRRDRACPCVWWDGCGESNQKQGNQSYEKGRKQLMEKLAAR